MIAVTDLGLFPIMVGVLVVGAGAWVRTDPEPHHAWERSHAHSGRAAFITGALLIVMGIVLQATFAA